MTKPFYITTAISYPNGRPHVGHAYEAIATDAIARWKRLEGREVRFLTGTDEHGLKMAQTARDRGIEPRALADEMSATFQEMTAVLNISHDRFIRTTDADHYAASVAIWEAMKANGDIYLGRYEGWYSVRDEAFYDEKELVEGEGGEAFAAGHAGRMDGGGKLVLPAFRLSGPASRPLRSQPGLHPPRRAPQRGDELREGRAVRSVDLADQLRLGRASSRCTRPCDVCLGRCAHQLSDRRRLSRQHQRNGGRPISTSSARTSCVSMRSTGRPF